MLKTSCYSSRSDEKESLPSGKETQVRGLRASGRLQVCKAAGSSATWEQSGGAELPMIDGRGGGATAFRPIGVLLCFLLSTNEGAPLARLPSIAAYQQAPFTKRPRSSRPAGGAAPPRPAPPAAAPPRRGRGPSRLLPALEVGAGLPPGSCVLRPPRRCRARWLPIVLRRGCGCCLFASRAGAAGAGAVAPPAGHGCPEQIHEKLHYYEKQNPVPILHGAAVLADDLAEELQNKPLNSEIRELLKLLSKPNVKALLSVHDTVAQKNYDPVLPPMPDDIDDEEDSVKIIRLVKNREPLGATIKKDEQTGAIVVARIMRGGAADRSGLIHVGDELREVNGIPVEDKRPEEIIQILAQSQGAITFKIIPSIKEETPSKEGKMFIKALFDYNPNEDKAIPCKEAGLSFKKGDILQIMSQDDATWWQAKHAGDANPRAGLIPSKHFQERRLALRRPEILVQPFKVSSRKSSGFRRSFRLSRKDKKTNKSMYECKKSDQYDTADVPTYEEVTPYRRQTNEKYRLVVLVGGLPSRYSSTGDAKC
ncbi:MAGUK p55 subfamily member 7-like [Canis lupus baileyi]|uniref:MAGUK p55 subfamily member 7-like n=1 Tax=Canis lupus baileyi TaxID=143281 RepID=UPI003B97A479